jgi:hypothetical protein
MLLSITMLKRIVASLFVVSLMACGRVTPAPTLTATTAPSLTPIIPSLTSTTIPLPATTITATLEPIISPGCAIVNEVGQIFVLSDQVFFALGPSAEELDQALADNYPEWASYKQKVSWSPEFVTVGKIVREASFQEKFALNSAVTLVTLGDSRNWQLPLDGDLFSESLTVGERLHHLWFEWTSPENEYIRTRYPQVVNAATYALYVFFDHDTYRLQTWCNAYEQLFGISPASR